MPRPIHAINFFSAHGIIHHLDLVERSATLCNIFYSIHGNVCQFFCSKIFSLSPPPPPLYSPTIFNSQTLQWQTSNHINVTCKVLCVSDVRFLFLSFRSFVLVCQVVYPRQTTKHTRVKQWNCSGIQYTLGLEKRVCEEWWRGERSGARGERVREKREKERNRMRALDKLGFVVVSNNSLSIGSLLFSYSFLPSLFFGKRAE